MSTPRAAHVTPPATRVVQALLCAGPADDGLLASRTGLRTDVIAEVVDTLVADGVLERRTGRFPALLVPEAHAALARAMVAADLDASGRRGDLEEAYDAFLPVNDAVLAACTDWQVRPDPTGSSMVNDHRDRDYDHAIIARLAAVHSRAEPVLEAFEAAMARLGGYAPRLRTALSGLLDGHPEYFTKPLFPSYHSIWFEMHQDLLGTLGRSRDDDRSR